MTNERRWYRTLEQPVAALATRLGGALAGDRRDLHAARVASRRVREVLALVRPAVGRRRYSKLVRRFRRVTRLLGQVRELDVSLAILDEMRESRPPFAADVQAFKAGISAERDEQLQAASARLGLQPEKLGRKMARALARLETDWDWRVAFRAHVNRRGRRLEQALGRAGVTYDASRLHDVRISLKRFRYAVELAAGASGRGAARQLGVFRRGQDLLGRMHDLHVVAANVRAQAAAGRDRADALADAIETDIRHAHAQYLALGDRLGRSVEQCLARFGASTAEVKHRPGRGATAATAATAATQARGARGARTAREGARGEVVSGAARNRRRTGPELPGRLEAAADAQRRRAVPPGRERSRRRGRAH